MKVAQVTTFFHPVTGGVETHVLNLSRELKELGHDVTVLCSDSNKQFPRIKEKKTGFLGVDVIRFRTIFSISFYHKFFPGIFFYLLRHKFDIIHVHGFRKSESYFALIAGWLKRTPVILTTHNPFPTRTRSKKLNMFIKLHDLTIGKILSGKFTKIISLVPSEVDLLKKKFRVDPKKIKVIPNGIPEEFFKEGDGEKFLREWDIDKSKWKAILIGVGRINYAKGFQNLELAVKENKDILFFIAGGEDGYLTKLKYIFAKSENIIFSEQFLPPAKVKDALAGADLFVFPSLHEAFGIAAFEAMAQGLPVVSTNVGGPAEVLKPEYAVLLDPSDQKAWRDTIEWLTDDPAYLQKMSKAARKDAQNYAWEHIVKEIAKLYSEARKK